MQVKDLPTEYTDIQDNFIYFINGITARTNFNILSPSTFWISMMDSYPHLANVVLKLILPFPTTYKCETDLSTLLNLKCKTGNKMASVDSEMRVALSQIHPSH